MAERSKALDSKSSKGQLFGGSNPPLSVCLFTEKEQVMVIRQSAEDYLEAILFINEKKGFARSIDIAKHLGLTKPSVSVAVKNLKNEGYIDVDEKGNLLLLPKGEEIAKKTYDRHVTIRDLLISLGVDPETAAKDACRMEHAISDESFNAIKTHALKHKEEK